jgi:hypothetical protein
VSKSADQELLQRISKLLSGGLKTVTEPIPEDNQQFDARNCTAYGAPSD